MAEKNNEQIDIFKELGIEQINENTQKYYSIMAYGKSGTGKTTLATRENNAFIIDVHEDGTRVTKKGFVKKVDTYNSFRKIVANIDKIIEGARNRGVPVDVVVIETAQKLRDITLAHVLQINQ